MIPRALYTHTAGEVYDLPDTDAFDDEGPVPCIACTRPASPYVDTTTGPVCFRCHDGYDGGGPAPAPTKAGMDTLLTRTALRILAARAGAVLEAAPAR